MSSLNTKLSSRELFANIAHQWRQPLSSINSIVGSIDNRLYERGIDDSLVTEQLLEIERLTKYMSDTIDEFRNYFEGQESAKKLFYKDIIVEAVDITNSNLKKNNIDLILDLNTSIKFNNDSKILKQILVILLNNAIDALVERSVHKPKIKLSSIEKESYVTIKVCDNAGGITKSVMNKIFEPNFTTKHKLEGTGAGLYMTSRLVKEELNGFLEVKNIEAGACFSMKIPRG